MRKQSLAAIVSCILPIANLPTVVYAVDATPLLEDVRFERGFAISAENTQARPIELGDAQPEKADGPPVWRLAQWGTRLPLEPGPGVAPRNFLWRLKNEAKTVVVEQQAKAAILTLHLDGIFEADGKLRAKGEPWPHLLVEQKLDVSIGELAGKPLRFRGQFKIMNCTLADWAEGKIDSKLHTAQVSAYWMVKAKTPDGTPQVFWFGIPFFDARHRIPPGHYAMDFAQSGPAAKFIANLEGERFWERTTGNGLWHELDVDLAPHLRYALERAQDHGHMEGVELEDLRLTSFNLGWEITGPYDAMLQVRDLALTADRESGE